MHLLSEPCCFRDEEKDARERAELGRTELLRAKHLLMDSPATFGFFKKNELKTLSNSDIAKVLK